ncbi:NAD(P)H-dependent flavin oxidoreductase [Adhaeribacter radiodurans]|uniref:Nitronate monooxygenase n=1 Tax=Adhaeribacter radiodurans TaxID=2745197 RepID=A0A7L7L4Z5_9BACT|nr:nitronate monooxygenase [Adhaeribacter radiodurans]QMU27665.1 nitronate monooxygenase [Adhaeribacter radiodurans]
MEWQNELTRLVKTSYPIVQAPMLGVTTPAMVAAISNAGGLGSLPVGGLSPDQTRSLILQTKALTTKPFAVNLFAHQNSPVNTAQADQMLQFLKKLCAQHQINYPKPDLNSIIFHSYEEQIDILLEENIPVVSFTFGILNKEVIHAFKEKGTVLIGTATYLAEATLLEQNGIDCITAQGMEAGGHRGTFLDSKTLPLIGSFSLIPLVAENCQVPVLAAGGIYNGKTIKAAFTLGAKGVQLGSAFISSNESLAIESYKKSIHDAAETDSVLTKTFSGRWARGIQNKFMMEVENSGLAIPDYPIQNALTTPLRVLAQKQNNKDFTTLWAGQSASKAESKPAGEIFQKLIKETESLP